MLERPWMGACGKLRSKNASSWLRLLPVGGAANAGDHDSGCAKAIALIGKAFAEAVLEMENR